MHGFTLVYIYICELPDFRKLCPYSSGKHFSKSCAPRKMMQNSIDEIFWGRTFKNTFYFNLRVPVFWKPPTCGCVGTGVRLGSENSSGGGGAGAGAAGGGVWKSGNVSRQMLTANDHGLCSRQMLTANVHGKCPQQEDLRWK